jgi:hypothetical protein
MEQVPDRVKMAVKIALDQLATIARGLENGRRADAMFDGCGRYEWEVWTEGLHDKLKRIDTSLATLQQFRINAAAKGIDPEVTIAELGGVPRYEPSDAIDRWMRDAQREIPFTPHVHGS